ncbi:MAG: Chromosome-partitioning protein Spo0J [Firmicutes bacterium ADurb.Bin506]|nr:MAG: Chromosome-partitioning protein Spo0J [Firmicutes bacterium ADurb.Bin506]
MSKSDAAPTTAVKIPKGGLNLQNISMDKISIKKGFNPRSDLGDLSELKRSLSEHGVQVPIIVCPTKPDADTYYVIAGHRRFTVWQEMGKPNIPASVRADLTISSPEALALSVTENSEDVRTSLTPLDQAKVFSSLLDSTGGNRDTAHLKQVGDMTGYSRVHVARTVKLLLVPKAIKERLQRNEISVRAAVAVIDVPDDIRDRVVSKVGVGTTESDVARMVNEVRREARAAAPDAAAAPAAGRGQATPSRHNTPIGAAQGTWVNPRGMREVRKMIEHVAADVLNCDEDIKEDASKAEELAPVRAVKANQLVALLWQVGALDKLDVDTKDFKRTLAEIRGRLEERMKKAEPPDKPKAPKAAPAAPKADPAPAAAGDADEDEAPAPKAKAAADEE